MELDYNSVNSQMTNGFKSSEQATDSPIKVSEDTLDLPDILASPKQNLDKERVHTKCCSKDLNSCNCVGSYLKSSTSFFKTPEVQEEDQVLFKVCVVYLIF